MQASSATSFSASASPFQMNGGPLFKTAGNEPVAAPPINSTTGLSPFSVAGATPTNAPLTVGDVIQQLPPEVVRGGALPMEQPLSLPPALVENALRSGQAALPVFELYRVCPALFQMPISPQDPRMVALPATKLPGLIAQAREGAPAAQPQAMPPSGPAGAGASPFSMGQPVPTPGSPAGSPFQMQPPASPFSAAAPGFAPAAPRPEQAGGSPFSMQPPAADAMGGSPFSMNGAAAGSPFGMPAAGAPAGSPFSMGGATGSPFEAASAPGAAPGGSPFTSASAPQPAPGAPAGSPFSLGGFLTSVQPAAASAPSPAPGAPAGSPFSLGGGAGGSPFGAAQAPQPAPGAPAGSPFSLGGAAGGSPFGAAQAPQPAPGAPAGSPFSLGGAAGGSPFGAAQAPQPAPGAPAGSPFSLGGAAGGSPFVAAPEPQPAPGAPAGTFSLGGGAGFGAAPAQQPAPAGSLFGAPAANATATLLGGAPAASPFGSGSMGGSPFGAAPAAQPPPAPEKTEMGQISISQLFTPQSQAQASTPSDAGSAPAMPFGSPFVSAMKEAAPPPAEPPAPPSMPAGLSAFATISQQPSAQAPMQFAPASAATPSGFAPLTLQPAASAAPSAFGTPAPAPAAGSTASAPGVVKLGFAAALNGRSMDELGFNPSTLPAWISTNVPAHVLKEQMASGNFVVELGLLIDGLTDVGFRNTLGSARRDCRIRLPQNEVFHALTQTGNAPAAAAQAIPAGVLPAARPTTMQVVPAQPQPGAPVVQPLFTQPAAEPRPEPMPGAVLNPFGQSQQAPAPVSAFGAPPPAAAPASFSFPAAPAQAPASPPPGFGFSPAPAEPPPAACQQPAGMSLFGGAPPAAPQQPMSGAFQNFSAPATGSLKPFDPFASSAAGPLPASKISLPGDSASGFSSAQLLGQAPAPPSGGSLFAPAAEFKPQATGSLFAPAPEIKPPSVSSLFAPAPAPESKPATTSLFASPSPALLQPTPAIAPSLEEIPSFSAAPVPEAKAATRSLFGSAAASIPLFSDPAPAPRSSAAPAPPPAPAPARPAAAKTSYLGLAPLDTQTDQLLLRALLATEEKLDAQRVVEMLATLPGLSACVCLSGTRTLSHADRSNPEATQFQQQAPEIARQVRGLVPLIGIDGAETFTLNAGGRLLTFCFPGESIVGVLHDEEPSTGMRDKITLIARELARMLG